VGLKRIGELRRESSRGKSRPPRERGGRYSLGYYSLSHLPRSAFIRIRVRRPKRHNCTRSLAGRRRHAFFFDRTMREYLVAHPDILMLKRTVDAVARGDTVFHSCSAADLRTLVGDHLLLLETCLVIIILRYYAYYATAM